MELIDYLKRTARHLRQLENEAADALYQNGNKAVYTDKLRRKTEILAQLPHLCSDKLQGLSSERCAFLQDRLGGMSFSAEKALQLNSIFYMSALLYPENYKEGDKNDLENCIELLEAYE